MLNESVQRIEKNIRYQPAKQDIPVLYRKFQTHVQAKKHHQKSAGIDDTVALNDGIWLLETLVNNTCGFNFDSAGTYEKSTFQFIVGNEGVSPDGIPYVDADSLAEKYLYLEDLALQNKTESSVFYYLVLDIGECDIDFSVIDITLYAKYYWYGVLSPGTDPIPFNYGEYYRSDIAVKKIVEKLTLQPMVPWAPDPDYIYILIQEYPIYGMDYPQYLWFKYNCSCNYIFYSTELNNYLFKAKQLVDNNQPDPILFPDRRIGVITGECWAYLNSNQTYEWANHFLVFDIIEKIFIGPSSEK